jgi:hypothetical protein
MTIIDILKETYDREMQNVFCYSANWLMTVPKKTYEREWLEANDKADVIRKYLAEHGVEV